MSPFYVLSLRPGECALTGLCETGARVCTRGAQDCGLDPNGAAAAESEECDTVDNDCDGAFNERNTTPAIDEQCCIGTSC